MAVYVADLRSTTGWSERWVAADGSFATTADGFRITKTGETGSYAITWDTIDSDANRDVIEILAKVRLVTQAAATTMVGVVCRGAGASGAQDLVRAYLYDAGNDGADRFIIDEYASGSQSIYLASTSRSNVANTWYWIKVRADGTSCQARLWADGSAEPATWTLDATVSVNAVGWAGIYAFDTATDPYDLGYFAVATNGDTVSGSSGGFFLGADF